VREKGNDPIIEVNVIREAMHQNDGGLGARIISDVDAVLVSTHEPLCEIHLLSRLFKPLREQQLYVEADATGVART
jgi:hypothetical protein